MGEYAGLWWLILWSSKCRIIEIGIGDNKSSTTNCVYQIRTYKFLFLYLSIAKPTLLYLKQEQDIQDGRK